MRPAKLNAFARVMRLWDEVHPYNAVQAMRLAGPADVERIDSAWRRTLAGMRIGHVQVNGDKFTHTAANPNDDRIRVRVISAGETLDDVLSREMNTAFDPNECCPFRAFILSDGETHIAGVTYYHFAADSYSIRWLLREWLASMLDPKHQPAPANVTSKGLWELFGPRAAKWELDDAVLGLLRYRTRFSRVRRCVTPMGTCRLRVTLHELPQVDPGILASRAKERGVTMHDLLLAVFAQATDQFGATPATKNLDELSIGTVVDLRNSSPTDLRDQFGLFLGFTTTILRPRQLKSLPLLLKEVAAQNAWQKESKAAQKSMLRMGIGLVEAKMYSARRWSELYRDRMPVSAGISNVNMNREWTVAFHPATVIDYYRVAPPGPMLPMIVSPTTLGRKMQFLLTRQIEQIDDSSASRIVDFVTNRLQKLAADESEWDRF